MPKLRRISLYTLETVFKILNQIDLNPNRTSTFIEERVGSIDHDSFDSQIVYLLNEALIYFPERRALRLSQKGQKCLELLREAKRLLDEEPTSDELQRVGLHPDHGYATKKDMDWMDWLDTQGKQPHVPDSHHKDEAEAATFGLY